MFKTFSILHKHISIQCVQNKNVQHGVIRGLIKWHLEIFDMIFESF